MEKANLKLLFVIYFLLLILVLVSTKYFSIYPSNMCLVSKELDRNNKLFTIVKIVENEPDYYIISNLYSSTNNEWIKISRVAVDKVKAFSYIREMRCP